jgi:hypothetical protein
VGTKSTGSRTNAAFPGRGGYGGQVQPELQRVRRLVHKLERRMNAEHLGAVHQGHIEDERDVGLVVRRPQVHHRFAHLEAKGVARL